jgi:hypothetical protein
VGSGKPATVLHYLHKFLARERASLSVLTIQGGRKELAAI